MSNKVILQSPSVGAPTPSRKPQDKTAKVAAAHFSEQNAPQAASLKTKQFTWKTPFVAFFSLIMSLLSFFSGNNEPNLPPRNAPQAAAPAQVKPATDGNLDTLLHLYADTIRKLAPAALDPEVVNSLINHELAKVKKKSETVQLSQLRDIALSNKNLTRISDKLKQMESQQRVNNSCLDLAALLKQHFTDQISTKIFEQIRGGFVQKVEEAFSDPDGNPNSKISRAAKELINTVVLRDIRSQMENGLIQRVGDAEGKELAAAILSDPAIIGETIHNNQEILTPGKRSQIIAKAKVVLEHYTQFKQGLESVKKYLSQGNQVIRDTILEKHPAFATALAYMPAVKKEEFERLLKETWINNKIQKITEYRRTPFEKVVLKGLGYKASAKGEKGLKEAMIFMLNCYLKDPKLSSVEQVKAEFKKFASEARLRDAGVPPSEVEQTKQIIQAYRQELETLMAEADREAQALISLPNLPKAEGYLRDLLFDHHCTEIEKYLAAVMANPPGNKEKLRASFKKIPPHVQKGIDWFNKYGAMVHSEFAQGEKDPNAVLGRGICAGLCVRLIKQSFDSPTASTDQIAILSDEKKDRMNQAYHHLRQGSDSKDETFILPKEILGKAGLREKQRLNLATVGNEGDLEVLAGLIETLQSMKNTNGSLILGWANHATALRFDDQNQKFLFFDPNFGTLEFKKGSKETLDALAERMALAYVEHYQWAYPKRSHMIAQQIIKKSVA